MNTKQKLRSYFLAIIMVITLLPKPAFADGETAVAYPIAGLLKTEFAAECGPPGAGKPRCGLSTVFENTRYGLAGDKIFLWENLKTPRPLCNAYTVNK